MSPFSLKSTKVRSLPCGPTSDGEGVLETPARKVVAHPLVVNVLLLAFVKQIKHNGIANVMLFLSAADIACCTYGLEQYTKFSHTDHIFRPPLVQVSVNGKNVFMHAFMLSVTQIEGMPQ